ncbi:MAG: hypothetical protein ACTHJT_05780 [Cytophaga sp.]|uniref:hypothetical protein n=1 Tax=Cytophaga sp. TaxID=29535 RepID=UPI003F800E38
MEFLIEMKTAAPGLRLKSIRAESLFDAVIKITAIIVMYCAKERFAFRVKPIKANEHMVHFKVFFDKRRRTDILLFNPDKYADAASIYNRS